MVRRAEPADAEAIGRLLHDFNTEYEQETPDAGKIAERFVPPVLAEERHGGPTSG